MATESLQFRPETTMSSFQRSSLGEDRPRHTPSFVEYEKDQYRPSKWQERSKEQDLSKKRLILEENDWLREKYDRLQREYVRLIGELDDVRLGRNRDLMLNTNSDSTIEQLRREKQALCKLLEETLDNGQSRTVAGRLESGAVHKPAMTVEEEQTLRTELKVASDEFAKYSREAKELQIEVDKWKNLYEHEVKEKEKHKLSAREEFLKERIQIEKIWSDRIREVEDTFKEKFAKSEEETKNNLGSKIAGLGADLDKRKKEWAYWLKRADDAEERAFHAEKESRHKTSLIEDLEHKVEKLNGQLKLAGDTKGQLESEKNVCFTNMEEARTKMKELSDYIGTQKFHIEKIRVEKEELEFTILQLESQNRALLEQASKKNTTVEHLKERLESVSHSGQQVGETDNLNTFENMRKREQEMLVVERTIPVLEDRVRELEAKLTSKEKEAEEAMKLARRLMDEQDGHHNSDSDTSRKGDKKKKSKHHKKDKHRKSKHEHDHNDYMEDRQSANITFREVSQSKDRSETNQEAVIQDLQGKVNRLVQVLETVKLREESFHAVIMKAESELVRERSIRMSLERKLGIEPGTSEHNLGHSGRQNVNLSFGPHQPMPNLPPNGAQGPFPPNMPHPKPNHRVGAALLSAMNPNPNPGFAFSSMMQPTNQPGHTQLPPVHISGPPSRSLSPKTSQIHGSHHTNSPPGVAGVVGNALMNIPGRLNKSPPQQRDAAPPPTSVSNSQKIMISSNTQQGHFPNMPPNSMPYPQQPPQQQRIAPVQSKLLASRGKPSNFPVGQALLGMQHPGGPNRSISPPQPLPPQSTALHHSRLDERPSSLEYSRDISYLTGTDRESLDPIGMNRGSVEQMAHHGHHV